MAKAPKAGGRLRNPRPELDVAADTKDRDCHLGMCLGCLGGTLDRLHELVTEPNDKRGTRIHKDDARQIRHLLSEFETEMRELLKDVRVQKHGVRDRAVDVSMAADTSNVVSLMIRRSALPKG